jgi:acyl-CoA synthetase (AMP-forming)/AMP-acid ligase II
MDALVKPWHDDSSETFVDPHKRGDMLDIISKGAADAPAILASDRAPLTFGALHDLATETIARLNALGIGRNDRVAIVLPNGPEMAAAFVSIAAGATTAPLNPAYRAEEFEFYLTDLKARALVLDAAGNDDAEAVARKLGVPILRLETHPGSPAGSFRLTGQVARRADPAARNSPRLAGRKLPPHGRGHRQGRRARPGTARRHRAGASHLRHHLASKDRAAQRSEHRRLGQEHPRDACADAC